MTEVKERSSMGCRLRMRATMVPLLTLVAVGIGRPALAQIDLSGEDAPSRHLGE